MLSELDGFVIVKKENNVFEIRFNQESRVLMHSVLKTHLLNGYADETYRTLTVKAHSLKRLHEYQEGYKAVHGSSKLLVSDTAKAIRSLSIQLNYILQYENHSVLGYNPEYIVVVNDQHFVLLCSELVVPLFEDTKTIMVSCPFSLFDFYVSPEIKRIQQIPIFIDYRTAYFSFGCLLLHLMVGNHAFYVNYVNGIDTDLLRVLESHPVKNTKIYWLLSRCLAEEAKKRTILLI